MQVAGAGASTEHNHLPVKSVSKPSSIASAFSHVHDASGLAPHGHEAPLTAWFSVAARSHVHCPTGREPIRISISMYSLSLPGWAGFPPPPPVLS